MLTIKETPPEKQCNLEGCKRSKYLRHDYCAGHWRKQEIGERWSRWIAANNGFQPLKHLAVHWKDWVDIGLPDEWEGFSVKPLGVDVCTCDECEKRRHYSKAAMEGVR